MNKYLRLLTDKNYRVKVLVAYTHIFNSMPDEKYLRMIFKAYMGKDLDLDNPKTYSEKLQWLKLYNRKPEYTTMVDKAGAKEYAASRIGSEYIIPTLGVWDNVDDIDFDALPDQFVLKCTHDSGGMVICKNKAEFNKEAAIRTLKQYYKRNFFQQWREWPYKNVPHRIIGEQYMEDEKTGELRDYKFFTFDGKVKALLIASERQNPNVETKSDFFDENYQHLPFTSGHPNADTPPEKPANFELMKELAEKLAVGTPHLRVDFYEINGKVYFGEMTFFHWSGIVAFNPEEWDYKFGEWITLPPKSGIG